MSNSTKNDENEYSSSTASASSTANQAIMGIGVASMTATSLFSLSSPQGMWSCFNEFQLLMLLLLTGAYFPKEIVNFLAGMDFTSFSFSFIPTVNLFNSLSLTNWINFDLNDDYLKAIGMNSESALVNNISVVCTFLAIIIIHCIYCIFHKILKKHFSEKPKLLKILNILMHIFTFNIYVRIMLESSQFILVSSAYEIRNFNVENVARKTSLSIAFVIFAICIAFVIFTTFQTYLFVKQTKKSEDSYFTELVEGMKKTKLAKCYSCFVMLRKFILISFLRFAKDLSIYATVGIVVFIEINYIIILIYNRPFESTKDNFLEILNELVFLGQSLVLFHFKKQSDWNNTMILAFILTVTLTNLLSAVIHIVLLFIIITKQLIKCCNKTKIQAQNKRNIQIIAQEPIIQNSQNIMITKNNISSANSEIQVLNKEESVDFYLKSKAAIANLYQNIWPTKLSQRSEIPQNSSKQFQALISQNNLMNLKITAISSSQNIQPSMRSKAVSEFIMAEENKNNLDPLSLFYSKRYEDFCKRTAD